MNKILRYSFVAILAVLGFGNAMAEDVIWQEDFSSYEANAVPEGCTDGASATKIYSDNLAGGTAPELLIGKKSNDVAGGSYTVTINLNGKSGEMFLQYKANYDRLEVTVSGATLGDKDVSGKSYTYPLTVASGTSSITITFTNVTTSNVRFDDAKVYQGTAKKPAGLDWGTGSRSVTIGANDNVFPVLSNPNNLSVEYGSTETGVATISSDGSITLVSAGKTDISASFAGNSEYEAQTVSYTLTVKEAEGGEGGEGGGGEGTVTEATVAQALAVIEGLADGAKTDGEYKVTGYVVEVTEISTEHGNATFTIADAQGGSPVLTVFRAKDANGEDIKNANFLKVNDLVVVQGKLQKYVKGNESTPEVAQGGKVLTINGETASGADPDPGPGPDPQPLVGDGSKENPYIVADLLGMDTPSDSNPVEGQQRVWLKGIIVGALNSSGKAFDETVASNIAIAAAAGEEDATKCIPVQLPTGDMRAGLNVVDNPTNKGKEVMVCGYLLKYMSRAGIKNVAAYILDGTEVTGITNITADQLKNAPAYNVAGQRVNEGYKGLIIKGGVKVVVK